MADLTNASPVERLVTEWAAFTYERLQRQLQRRRIEASGELQAGLQYEIRLQGDAILARFRFPLHGKFVDMGVGNGVSVATRAAYRTAAGKGGRRKKPWFNRPFYGRYYWLAEAVATQLAERVVREAAPTLTTTLTDGD
jgi:hypothetical protein